MLGEGLSCSKVLKAIVSAADDDDDVFNNDVCSNGDDGKINDFFFNFSFL